MLRDAYDRTLLILLALALTALCLVLAGRGSHAGLPPSADQSMEKELAYQARVALLQRLYAPVEELKRTGNLQGALFKLDELAQKYPSEAHGRVLKGEILRSMGAFDEALHCYADGVRLNGEYLDRKSPLSRRADIQLAAEEGERSVGARLRANPDNVSLAALLKDVRYLRSRLAGGCE